jgi:hypothetical protein
VVFQKRATPASATASAATNFPAWQPVQELGGEWRVAFDPRRGGPERPVVFSTLEDWTKRS